MNKPHTRLPVDYS